MKVRRTRNVLKMADLVGWLVSINSGLRKDQWSAGTRVIAKYNQGTCMDKTGAMVLYGRLAIHIMATIVHGHKVNVGMSSSCRIEIQNLDPYGNARHLYTHDWQCQHREWSESLHFGLRFHGVLMHCSW